MVCSSCNPGVNLSWAHDGAIDGVMHIAEQHVSQYQGTPAQQSDKVRRGRVLYGSSGSHHVVVFCELDTTVVVTVANNSVSGAAQAPGVVDQAWGEEVSAEDAAVGWLLHDGGQQIDQEVALLSAVAWKIVCGPVEHASHVCVSMHMVQLLAGLMS